MRIISGIYKGKKLNFPKSIKTRPLRDLVKESIFNLIENSNKFKFKMSGAKVLDLFSGSGSFGLECISRKSKMVTFFENYNGALNILKKNIKILNVENKCKIFEKNCFEFFKTKNFFKNEFDIIFMDPPYKEKNITALIDSILEKKILKDNGVLILHRHKNDNFDINSRLKILDERVYGISKIIIGN